MAILKWDDTSQRKVQAGVDRGVLYIYKPYSANKAIDYIVPWNGLTKVSERSVGGSITPYYDDGIKIRDDQITEDLELTIDAYTYPDEFSNCEGIYSTDIGLQYDKQLRWPFHISYRTMIGDDVNGFDNHYKLHIVYNCIVAPTQRNYESLSIDPRVTLFSWDIATTPVPIPGFKESSHIILDTRTTPKALMDDVEASLYGTNSTNPKILFPEDIRPMYNKSYFQINYVNITTGKYAGVNSSSPDVNGFKTDGIYTMSPDTRLRFTTTNGLYKIG